MILPIYTYGQPVLRQAAVDVDITDPAVREQLTELIPNMFETLTAAAGVGLAAPQVGQDIRLVVIDLTECFDEEEIKEDPTLPAWKRVFINPEIYAASEEACAMEEGCLSLPGLRENVQRPVTVRVRWMDEQFQAHDEELTDFPARVIQHECDHLDGTMFVDHLSGLRKQMVKGKLGKLLSGKVHADYKTKSVRK